jgi:ApbE superfamily uncharacterized protein (UPF0280 family)
MTARAASAPVDRAPRWGTPQVGALPGGRLHLQHGPIDLVIEANAPSRDIVQRARHRAIACFADILEGLVAELPRLRAPLGRTPPRLEGPVALRMLAACWPHRGTFLTPMAAVAGAVADEVLAAMTRDGGLDRAYVNNGGDIALHLAPGEAFEVGLADVRDGHLEGSITIDAALPVRGLATSGWRGRSLSLGIADAVTVLAADAAAADAAATLVANAVNVDHPAIRRLPAVEVRPDSDLGELPVTVAVDPLPREAVREALARGVAEARRMRAAGLIHAACLRLQGELRIEGAGPFAGDA